MKFKYIGREISISDDVGAEVKSKAVKARRIASCLNTRKKLTVFEIAEMKTVCRIAGKTLMDGEKLADLSGTYKIVNFND